MPREYPEQPSQALQHTHPASTVNYSSASTPTPAPAPVPVPASRGSSVSNRSVNGDHASEIDGNDGRLLTNGHHWDDYEDEDEEEDGQEGEEEEGRLYGGVLTNGYHWDEEEDIERLWINRPILEAENPDPSRVSVPTPLESNAVRRDTQGVNQGRTSHPPESSRIPRMTNGIFVPSNSTNLPPQLPPPPAHHTQFPPLRPFLPPSHPFQSPLPPWLPFHTCTQPPPSYSHPPPTHTLPSPSPSPPSLQPTAPSQPSHHTQPVIPSLNEFEQRIESARLCILQADYEIRAAERRRGAAQRDMAVAALDMLALQGVGFRVGEGWLWGGQINNALRVDGRNDAPQTDAGNGGNGDGGGVHGVDGTAHGSEGNNNDNDHGSATNVSATNNADTGNVALTNGVSRLPGERDAEVTAPLSNDEWLSSSSEESVDEDEDEGVE